MRDQHGAGLVVSEVRVVGDPTLIVQRDHVAVRVQPSPEVDGERRTLGVPGRLLVPHPLHPHGAAQLPGQVRGLEARVVRRRAPVELRAVHPDDPHLLCRHPQELGDPGAVAVRLHVVGVDRHLAFRGVGQGVGGTDGGVPVEGDVVRGFDDGRGARQRPVGVALHLRRRASTRARHSVRAPQVVEEVIGGGEGGRSGLLPPDLQPFRGLDRLLLALAHHGDVVALAHDPDEAGHVAYR